MRLLTPRARGASVWACTSSLGGGLVAGDRISLELQIETGARCFLSTQASTKIFRNPCRRPTTHTLRACIQPDAILILAPDPIQSFADSIYEQRQEFHLGANAGLTLVDWFGAGRTARGERWAFNRFYSRNDIFCNGEQILLDSLLLYPADGPLATDTRLGRFNCVALLVICGEPLREPAQSLLKTIAARPVEKRADLLCSASPLRNGALLRVAGSSVEQVGHELARHLGFVSDLLQGNPWSRKW